MQIVSRLIKKLVLNNYQLSISLDRVGRGFKGTAVINGFVTGADGTISLHSKDLDIKTVLVDGHEATFKYQDNDELLITHSALIPGEHIIVVGYSGTISDSLHGIYPCYFNHDGSKKELLITQFESHHAREAFPCIDEPEAKATFDLTLTTEPGVTVLGNMPVKDQRLEGKNLVTTFETTPRMSSYLLAWVVGELHKKTAKTKDGVEINIWATPAQSSESLDFALDIAVRTTEFFDQYFGTSYPLPKCDHVAIPDFSSGAMENWGLITYREICLLASPSIASISSKRYIATVIAHEISHQWFGNLVTMKWWDDLWLNESFATLIEYVAIDSLEPTWEAWFEFATYNCIAALKRDSLEGVQPVRVDVNHPDEISTLFDGAIVYAKGARLLQMLEHFIGDDVFRNGLRKYFKNYAYKNTDSNDLWSSLDDSSSKNIRVFMDKWLDQPGYPVLHVSKRNKTLTLTQERLSSDLSSKSDLLWPIPLNSNCPDLPKVFESKVLKVDTKFDQPILFNIDSYGHYVTHYDPEMLKQILGELEAGRLSIVGRLQLLNEQRILASVGIISNSDLVPLLRTYEHETSEPVWDIIGLTLGELKKFVENDELAESKLKALARDLASGEHKRLGWKPKIDEPEADSKLRSIIIGCMLYSDDEQSIEIAKKLYASNPLEKLNPELRPLIISAVIRHKPDQSLIDNLIETYKSTSSSELSSDICAGLTSLRDTTNISKVLDCLKDASIVRSQDVFRWAHYFLRNKYSRDLTWAWVQNNWDWIEATFGDDKSFDDYPRSAASTLTSRSQLKEFSDFFEPMLKIPALNRVINIGIKEISARVKLIEHDSDKVKQSLLNL